MAVYCSSTAFWQTVVEPAVKVVTPVEGFTVTTLLALVDPHNPVAVAVMVAVPLNAAFQSIKPLLVLIVPADAGDTV